MLSRDYKINMFKSENVLKAIKYFMFWSYICYIINHVSINKRKKKLFGDLHSLIIHLFRPSVWFVLLKQIFMSQCSKQCWHKLTTLISATCACRFNKQWYKWVLYIILISSFMKSNELKGVKIYTTIKFKVKSILL